MRIKWAMNIFRCIDRAFRTVANTKEKAETQAIVQNVQLTCVKAMAYRI